MLSCICVQVSIKLRMRFEIKQFMSVTLSKFWSWRKLLGIEVVLFEYVFFLESTMVPKELR